MAIMVNVTQVLLKVTGSNPASIFDELPMIVNMVIVHTRKQVAVRHRVLHLP